MLLLLVIVILVIALALATDRLELVRGSSKRELRSVFQRSLTHTPESRITARNAQVFAIKEGHEFILIVLFSIYAHGFGNRTESFGTAADAVYHRHVTVYVVFVKLSTLVDLFTR